MSQTFLRKAPVRNCHFQMKNIMKSLVSLFLIASFVLSACSSNRTIEVLITSNAYKVNHVSSPLATPAVDEVVRSTPKMVLILRCQDTPNAKIIQFERELRARYMSPLEMSNAKDGC